MDTVTKKKIYRITMVAACIAAILVIGIFSYKAMYSAGVFLPSGIEWSESTSADDFLNLEIKDKKTVLTSKNGQTIWVSPQKLKIQNGFAADIDEDGNSEIVLLLWKTGSFGDHLPFWVEKNDNEWGQHIFIYRYDASSEKVSEAWCSSSLGTDITGMQYLPADNMIALSFSDGREEKLFWDYWGLSFAE